MNNWYIQAAISAQETFVVFCHYAMSCLKFPLKYCVLSRFHHYFHTQHNQNVTSVINSDIIWNFSALKLNGSFATPCWNWEVLGPDACITVHEFLIVNFLTWTNLPFRSSYRGLSWTFVVIHLLVHTQIWIKVRVIQEIAF